MVKYPLSAFQNMLRQKDLEDVFEETGFSKMYDFFSVKLCLEHGGFTPEKADVAEAIKVLMHRNVLQKSSEFLYGTPAADKVHIDLGVEDSQHNRLRLEFSILSDDCAHGLLTYRGTNDIASSAYASLVFGHYEESNSPECDI